MSDSYLDFANSALGSRIAAMLGLPQPVPLERYRADQPVIKGSVLIGTGGNPELLPALSTALHALGATSVAHRSAPQWVALANQAGMMTGRWGVEDKPGEKVKALVFDATGLEDSTQSDALYQFFHDAARSVLPCGRVVVIGRPPESCTAPRKATVQRALEGLTRSLGKELKRGITAQLVYVAPGAEEQLESTLRFLLSPRSAYVSAQVVRIGLPVGPAQAPTDWRRPLEGKKVLVTGASRGIGAAIAEVMARDGAQVICLDVPQAQAGLDEVAARLGGKALALDIGAPEAPAALVAAAQADGGWDVVVHNAGITRDKTIANMKDHLWQAVVNVNLSHPGAHQRGAGGGRCPQVGCAHRLRVVHLRHCRQSGPNQLRAVQGRCHRHGAKHCAELATLWHHHQRSGAGLYRNADDCGCAVCHPRGGPPHELHGAGRSAGGCGRDHCLVCQPGLQRSDRQRGARVRTKPARGLMP